VGVKKNIKNLIFSGLIFLTVVFLRVRWSETKDWRSGGKSRLSARRSLSEKRRFSDRLPGEKEYSEV
jgi:hypothetical protein